MNRRFLALALALMLALSVTVPALAEEEIIILDEGDALSQADEGEITIQDGNATAIDFEAVAAATELPDQASTPTPLPTPTRAPLATAAPDAPQVDYQIAIWLEKPNIVGDPGDPSEDPAALSNYELFMTVTRQAPAGSDVLLTATDFDAYIRSPRLNRRYATFRASDVGNVNADGTGVVNAYFARGEFTYVFHIGRDEAAMEIDGVTYEGTGDQQYTFKAKYEQAILVPGVDNGLLPYTTSEDEAGIMAFCAGWSLDPRAGMKLRMTYERTVSEELLPTDDMPYEDLVYELTGQWSDNGTQRVVANYYEQVPGQSKDEYKSMEYEGVTYLNNPAGDLKYTALEGSKPKAETVEGLEYVGRVDPNPAADGDEAYTYKFLYKRARYSITFANGDTVKNVPYGAPTSSHNPGGTWYVDEACTTEFPWGNMPAMDLTLYKK